MTAREACTRDYWAKSQAVLYRHDPFAKSALILLAQCHQESLAPLANAATKTLIHAVKRGEAA